MSAESKAAVFPAPAVTELNAPYWRALDEGRLVFQRCRSCGHAWLPPRSECPRCLAADYAWEAASGRAKLVSWVVYHHAYHDYFAAKLPYNVAVVELAEGPRLTTNVDAGEAALAIDMPLQLVVQRESGIALPRFRPG
jgi:uncharacterized OB-fold protein